MAGKYLKEVWVLGSQHSKAHRSILWLSPFPNFCDADILIVNLASFPHDKIGAMRQKLDEAQRYIFDMLMTGEKEVVVIMSTDQVLLNSLPVSPIIKKIRQLKPGKLPEKSAIQDYLKNVVECDYYIHNLNLGYVEALTTPGLRTSENYFFTSKAREGYSLDLVVDYHITNRAKQIIGGSFGFAISYGKGLMPDGCEGRFFSGPITFFPQTTDIPPEEAIDGLLIALTGGKLTEPSPKWEQKIDFPGLKILKTRIGLMEKAKERLTNRISELETKVAELVRLRRLLWADSTPLENAVKDAFVILGFSEIRKIRDPNLEDWVIDFKYIDEFKHGVFEIKGAQRRTSLADLTQCNKWIEDYLLEKVKVKGIFVPNQYRREEMTKSRKKREHFEPNELDYARKREICILPTHIIFDILAQKMKGNKKITRKFIEQKISSASGLCTDLNT